MFTIVLGRALVAQVTNRGEFWCAGTEGLDISYRQDGPEFLTVDWGRFLPSFFNATSFIRFEIGERLPKKSPDMCHGQVTWSVSEGDGHEC